MNVKTREPELSRFVEAQSEALSAAGPSWTRGPLEMLAMGVLDVCDRLAAGVPNLRRWLEA